MFCAHATAGRTVNRDRYFTEGNLQKRKGSTHTTLLYIVQRGAKRPKRNISMGVIEIFYFARSRLGELRSPWLVVGGWWLCSSERSKPMWLDSKGVAGRGRPGSLFSPWLGVGGWEMVFVFRGCRETVVAYPLCRGAGCQRSGGADC